MRTTRGARTDAPWSIDEATDELLAGLDLALPPMTPPAGLLTRIEAAVAEAAAPSKAVVLDFAEAGRWRRLAPGVTMKLVWPGAFLLRCEPDAVAPDHEHPEAEYAVVVAGDLVTEHGVLHPGDCHRTAAGGRHARWTTRTGCLVLVQRAA